MALVVLDGDHPPRIVRRIPVGSARYENELRDLIYAQPEVLPVDDIDPAIGPLVPVARELGLPGTGRIDVFLADRHGHLVVVECKLWRNPQARREVVGQILDYARTLAGFSYDDLQREVSRATGLAGNALWELVRGDADAGGEARFVDRVSRNLAAGRFLLLVAGDGITEGTRRIGEYLVAQPGLAFSFAMVEMARYAWTGEDGQAHDIIQPRLLAKTELIERAIIRSEAAAVRIDAPEETEAAPEPTAGDAGGRKLDPELLRQWRSFAERFIASARFDDPAQPPPRIGGFGWLRLPLPGGFAITIWRSTKEERAGGFVRLPATGRARDMLVAERDTIDAEFADAGLPAPDWNGDARGTTIGLTIPASLPWDGEAEERQLAALVPIANQLVNSYRPRLERVETGA